MKNKFLITILFVAVLIIIGVGCTTSNDSDLVLNDPNLPKLCQTQTKNFPAEFPEDAIYPDSLRLNAYSVGTDGDKGGVGLLGKFCVKEDLNTILEWYKNKYEPQGYEYFTMEIVHYWKKNDSTIFLDLESELENGYIMYSVDVRS